MAQLLSGFWFSIEDLIELRAPVNLTEEGRGRTTDLIPVVNLLSLMEYLVSDYGITMDPQLLEEFWIHARDHERWCQEGGHPGLQKRSVPLALYGDSARYVDQGGFVEKVCVVLISMPLWNPKTTRASRWPLFACRESLMDGVHTLNTVYEYITWAANVLQSGIRPQAGYLNTCLPAEGAKIFSGNLTFSVVEIRGDWSWHCWSLNLKNRWNSSSMCFKCPARSNSASPEENYPSSYSESAWWTTRVYSHVQFVNSQLKQPICH